MFKKDDTVIVINNEHGLRHFYPLKTKAVVVDSDHQYRDHYMVKAKSHTRPWQFIHKDNLRIFQYDDNEHALHLLRHDSDE